MLELSVHAVDPTQACRERYSEVNMCRSGGGQFFVLFLLAMTQDRVVHPSGDAEFQSPRVYRKYDKWKTRVILRFVL